MEDLQMKRPILLSISVFVLAAFLAISFQVAYGDKESDAAIKLFQKYGCTECHSIVAVGIEKEAPKEGEEAEEVEEKAEEKAEDEPDPPDLSSVGLEHDAKWVSNYLRKKEEKDGRKHEKLFQGDSSERRALATWLASLKHKPDDKEKAEEPDEESADS
jgi:hypothetical protein